MIGRVSGSHYFELNLMVTQQELFVVHDVKLLLMIQQQRVPVIYICISLCEKSVCVCFALDSQQYCKEQCVFRQLQER